MRTTRRMLPLLCIVALCAGCNGTTTSENVHPVPSNMRSTYASYTDSVYVNDAYMQEIEGTLAYGGSNADVVHHILSDRMISSQEINELERQTISCFAEYGWTVNVDYWFALSGPVTAVNASRNSDIDKIGEIESRCQNDNGYDLLVIYYYKALYNPDNIDLKPYTFQCFQEHGLADKTMTYDEYNRLREQGKDPLIGDPARSTSSQHAIWNTCWDDPLHNISSPPPQR